MNLNFSKYHGTGNDFILIDNRQLRLSKQQTNLYKHLCHRRFGIGADGLILLQTHPDSEIAFEMVYFNADGQESSMCGNGGRCLVAFAQQLGMISTNKWIQFMAIDGLHQAIIDETGMVELKMQDVSTVDKYNTTSDYVLNTGSPHYVRFVQALPSIDVFTQGRAIRNSPTFKEAGINVNFVQAVAQNLHVATYERGVENETYSCGTGVVAASIAAVLHKQVDYASDGIRIISKGGHLRVRFTGVTPPFTNIYLQGPTVHVFDGCITKQLLNNIS